MRRPVVFLLALGSVVALGGCDDPTAPGASSLARVPGSDAPSGLTGEARSETEIVLRWADNSRNESGFQIHRSTNGRDGTYTLHAPTAPNAVEFIDAALTRTTEYCYKVRWFKTSGKNTTTSVFSETSCTYTLGPPLAPVVSLAPDATTSEAWIDVRWTDPLGTAQTFLVERADDPSGTWTALAADLPSSDRSYRDPSRPVETLACYRVTSANTRGSFPPSAVKCTAPPRSPTDLTVAVVNATTMEIDWTNNSGVNDGFEIQRMSEVSFWERVAIVPAVTIGYQDAGLVTDRRYYYRVRATKNDGYSAFSNVANVLLSGNPPVRSPMINAVANGSYAAWIDWYNQPPIPNTVGYRVERSLDNGATWVTAATLETSDWRFADGDRDPDQRVCYRVLSFNSVGDAPPWNIDCVTPVATPNDFLASPGGNGNINLTWTDESTANTGYIVEYFAWHYDPWYDYWYQWWVTLSDEIGASASSHQLKGFSSGELHLFRLIPIGPDGNGTTSNESASYSELPPPPPPFD